MVLNEKHTRLQSVLTVAGLMMTAARTAPKAKGIDILEIVTVTGDKRLALAAKMRELSPEFGLKFFLRDAENVEKSDAVVLVGTRMHIHNLNCGYCGFGNCAGKLKHPHAPCYFNSADVGIALGSAVSLATDMRVDTRIMYSAGVSAHHMGLIGDCDGVLAILLSCSSKNPFFDRVFEQK